MVVVRKREGLGGKNLTVLPPQSPMKLGYTTDTQKEEERIGEGIDYYTKFSILNIDALGVDYWIKMIYRLES